MNWFLKLIKFISPSTKVNEAKKAEIIEEAVKEATVTLNPWDKAVIEGKVISSLKKRKKAKAEKTVHKKDSKANLGLIPKTWVEGKASKKKISKPKSKVGKVKKKK
tara:strand:- start:104 stop:421 length:318 start_codon:yes stop_codon:yes gene_type:complete